MKKRFLIIFLVSIAATQAPDNSDNPTRSLNDGGQPLNAFEEYKKKWLKELTPRPSDGRPRQDRTQRKPEKDNSGKNRPINKKKNDDQRLHDLTQTTSKGRPPHQQSEFTSKRRPQFQSKSPKPDNNKDDKCTAPNEPNSKCKESNEEKDPPLSEENTHTTSKGRPSYQQTESSNKGKLTTTRRIRSTRNCCNCGNKRCPTKKKGESTTIRTNYQNDTVFAPSRPYQDDTFYVG